MPDEESKPAMPEQPKTTRLEAVPPWASELATAVRNIADNVGTMSQNVAVLMEDRPVLHSRLAGVEGRLARIETPSIVPPPAITSTRARALIDEHPSQISLETAARQSEEIIRGQERDKHIAETRALVENAATKGDVKALADTTATKAEVKELVDDAAKEQTTDIVTSVSKLAEKNTTVRALLMALAALAFVSINAATTYLTNRASAPPAPQTTTTITVPK